MNKLINKELLIKIYQYDPTYHHHFKKFVLPYLKKYGISDGNVKKH